MSLNFIQFLTLIIEIMKNSKSFTELSKSIENLSENAQGQLRGGFAVFSSSESIYGEDQTNINCGATCKNKNRRSCNGCSTTLNPTG